MGHFFTRICICIYIGEVKSGSGYLYLYKKWVGERPTCGDLGPFAVDETTLPRIVESDWAVGDHHDDDEYDGDSDRCDFDNFIDRRFQVIR